MKMKMKMKMKTIILSVVLIICLVFGGVATSSVGISNIFVVPSYAATNAVKAPTGLNLRRVDTTSVQLWWKKVDGVSGYVVYRYDKASKKYKAIKTLKSAKTTRCIDKGLDKNKTYTYRVKSYKAVKGKKSYSNFSSLASSKTWGSGVKAVNAGSVKVTPGSLTLGLCMKKTIKATPIPTATSKAKGKTTISKTVRWISSNRNIAKVDKNGLVTAQTKTGKCYIYAIAHNGVKKRITVKVKDYAKPAKFDLEGISKTGVDMLSGENKKAVCEIASYFSTHRPNKDFTIKLDGQNNLIVNPETDLDGMASIIEQFLLKQPNQVLISVTNSHIEFVIIEYFGENKMGNEMNDYHYITYIYDHEITEIDLSDDGFLLAPHWMYYLFLPT